MVLRYTKMTLKDWKKISKYQFKNEKTNQKIIIGKLNNDFLPDKYDVYIAGYRWNTMGYFRSKINALKTIKAYIRTH